MSMKSLIIVFSSREKGNSEHIAEFIQSNLRKNEEIFCFSSHRIAPCGNCRYECFLKDLRCPHCTDGEEVLLEKICRSDETIFVLPNYCDYPCANFFIFNERSNGFFQHHPERLDQYLKVPKKFIVISNSQSDHFRDAFTQHCCGDPEILFLSSKACETKTVGSELMNTKLARNLLEAFLQ